MQWASRRERADSWCWTSFQSGAEVKKRVELYLHFFKRFICVLLNLTEGNIIIIIIIIIVIIYFINHYYYY
jgi:hypothetical protein